MHPRPELTRSVALRCCCCSAALVGVDVGLCTTADSAATTGPSAVLVPAAAVEPSSEAMAGLKGGLSRLCLGIDSVEPGVVRRGGGCECVGRHGTQHFESEPQSTPILDAQRTRYRHVEARSGEPQSSSGASSGHGWIDTSSNPVQNRFHHHRHRGALAGSINRQLR